MTQFSFAVVKVSCIMFDNLELDVFDADVLSATLSCLLPLQLGFDHFKYLS